MTYKPPLCDCPSDASIYRLERLSKRVCRLRRPTQRNLEWSRRMEDALHAAFVRRCGCRWHDPGLHEIYFGKDAYVRG